MFLTSFQWKSNMNIVDIFEINQNWILMIFWNKLNENHHVSCHSSNHLQIQTKCDWFAILRVMKLPKHLPLAAERNLTEKHRPPKIWCVHASIGAKNARSKTSLFTEYPIENHNLVEVTLTNKSKVFSLLLLIPKLVTKNFSRCT